MLVEFITTKKCWRCCWPNPQIYHYCHFNCLLLALLSGCCLTYYMQSSLVHNITRFCKIRSQISYFYRIGTVLKHLAPPLSAGSAADDPLCIVLSIFWPMIEKLFKSKYMENNSLSTAACRALSQAIHASGNGWVLL